MRVIRHAAIAVLSMIYTSMWWVSILWYPAKWVAPILALSTVGGLLIMALICMWVIDNWDFRNPNLR